MWRFSRLLSLGAITGLVAATLFTPVGHYYLIELGVVPYGVLEWSEIWPISMIGAFAGGMLAVSLGACQLPRVLGYIAIGCLVSVVILVIGALVLSQFPKPGKYDHRPLSYGIPCGLLCGVLWGVWMSRKGTSSTGKETNRDQIETPAQ